MAFAEVSYTDPQGVFVKHKAQVEKYLKSFTNLHWRPNEQLSPNSTTRTIPQLKLRLTPEGSQKQPQHQIIGVYSPPLVQLLIFETTPVDIYRNKLRQIGKDWYHNRVNIREPTGFCVVQVVSPNDTPKAVKSIWTRLNNEFEPENCIQLHANSEESWKELSTLVKQELIMAFDSRVLMLEREIQKLQSTKDIPGWNSGTLFVVTEGLAYAFQSLNLIDDSLKVYSKLRGLCDQVQQKDWGTTHQTLDKGFTGSRDILIEPVLTKKASYFDIYRHITGSQVQLFLKLASEEPVDSLKDKYVERSIRLAIEHIPLIMESLVDTIGRWNANMWLLNSAKELYDWTAEYGSSKLNDGKGDILLIQRDALQRLGGSLGWTIPGMFNDISLSDKDDMKNDSVDAFTIKTKDEFISEFVKLTRTALGYFRVANMRRVVGQLSGQLSLIEYHTGNLEAAWEYFDSSLNVSSGSISLYDVVLLETALDCAVKLNFLEKAADCAWRILSLERKAPLPLYKKAIAQVQELDSTFSSEHKLDQWFKPGFSPYIRGDADGYYVEVELNPRASGYPFLKFTGAEFVARYENKLLVFQCAKPVHGVNRFYSRDFVNGILVFEKLTVSAGSQVFSYNFEPTQAIMKPLSTAFHASVRLGKKYSMRKRSIEMQINNTKAVKNAKLSLTPSDPNIQLLWEQAKVPEMTDFTSISCSIPVLVDYTNPHIGVLLKINYDDGYSYESMEILDFSLMVSVDFQEYYREPPKILLQFLVKPFQIAPITFSNACLMSSTNYRIEESKYDQREPFMAFSYAPISYIFSLQKINGSQKSTHPMQLSLTYRSIMWEIRHLIYQNLTLPPELQAYSFGVGNIVESLSQLADIELYLTERKVRILGSLQDVVSKEFMYMDPIHTNGILEHLESALTDCKAEENTSFEVLNSEITLEVPDPDASVVHYVKLEPEEAKTTCAVGEVLPIKLEIETICIQGDNSEKVEYEYMFDRLSDGWSYTGKVTGSFKSDERVSEVLNLIPHRSGELRLPNVVIRPKTGLDNESIVVAGHANSQILVVPDVNMLAITF